MLAYGNFFPMNARPNALLDERTPLWLASALEQILLQLLRLNSRVLQVTFSGLVQSPRSD